MGSGLSGSVKFIVKLSQLMGVIADVVVVDIGEGDFVVVFCVVGLLVVVGL